MNKKCFVISPIGQEESDTRKHADDVYETIIRPALHECEIDPIRADHMDEPGKITDQMIRAIRDYEISIAVLTDHNPNVFYEIAIAQAWAKPIVLLILKGQEIPFDVKDYRVVEYDLEPRNIYNGTWARMVVSQVKKLLSSDHKPKGLIDTTDLIKTSDSHGYWLSRTSKEFGEAPRYEDIVLKATACCDLLGISLSSWSRKSSSEALLKIAKSNCKVRILILHEDYIALNHLINNELPAQDFSSTKKEINDMFEHFNKLSGDNPNIKVRQIQNGAIHFQLILTDQEALCLQYLYSRTGSDSPLLRYPTGSPLYDAVRDEFNTLWELNKDN